MKFLFSALCFISLQSNVLSAQSFDYWYSKIGASPTNRLIYEREIPKISPVISLQEIQTTAQSYFQLSSNIFASSGWTPWLQTQGEPYSSFLPFVEHLELSQANIYAFHGDLHGDVHSLLRYLEKLKELGYLDSRDGFHIKDPRFVMIFLGDYVDRGFYGVEVLYILMRLKLANPHNVILVRGNHEDIAQNTAPGGLHDELRMKYGSHGDYLAKLYAHLYNTLPLALFATLRTEKGQEGFLAAHGGIEIGFDYVPFLKSGARFSLISKINRAPIYNSLPAYIQNAFINLKLDRDIVSFTPKNGPTDPNVIGFMWNDFIVDNGQRIVEPSERGPGIWSVGQPLMEQYLAWGKKNQIELHGMFRAHQHTASLDPMMSKILKRGLYRNEDNTNAGLAKLWTKDPREGGTSLWKNFVVTMNVAPDSVYGMDLDFNFDTFALLRVSENLSNWSLKALH